MDVFGRKKARREGETEGFMTGWTAALARGYQGGRQKVPWGTVKHDSSWPKKMSRAEKKKWKL